MTRVFLVRHAEPAAGWGGEDHDPGLSDRGFAQARLAAEALQALGPLDAICSPMRRCRETAAAYAGAPRIEPHVSEVVAPASVADRPAWLRATFPWADDQPRRAWADVDPALHAWRDAAVSAMLALERDAVVFTHFIAINAIVGAAVGSAETIVFRPGHASITALDLRAGALRVVSLGAETASDDVR